MGGLSDVLDRDATAQAALVRSGEVSARELALAAIARIEARDPEINAVVWRRFERALDELASSSFDRAAPFSGVPFLLKDLGPTCADSETTCGSRLLRGHRALADSELVRRLRAAGVVLLGKTATAEFGALPTTEPSGGAPTRNPWNRERSAGGSSGGAAAAVAAGLVPVAHANDAGGSIRIPAACCGVLGLKPTRARVSLAPDVGDLMNGLVTEFVVTRSVRDAAAMLDALSGPAVGDPYPAPPAPASFLAAIAPDRRRRLRIALADERIDRDCASAVAAAAQWCRELGHEIVTISPPICFDELRESFLTVWAAGVSSAVSAFAALSGREVQERALEDVTWWLYEEGRRVSAASYLLTIIRLQQAARRIALAFESFDVLLGTVTREPAPLLGALRAGTAREQLDLALGFVAETPLANLTGQPAISVPLWRRDDGVPIGVQLTARVGDEATLLSLAAELERARPWPVIAQPHP